MTELEAQKQLADAIILERALRVLDRTSRVPFGYAALHWVSVKTTLREVANRLRDGAEGNCG
jgi:hypothetical protein